MVWTTLILLVVIKIREYREHDKVPDLTDNVGGPSRPRVLQGHANSEPNRPDLSLVGFQTRVSRWQIATLLTVLELRLDSTVLGNLHLSECT